MRRVTTVLLAIGVMLVSGCGAAKPAAQRPDGKPITGTCNGMPARLLIVAGKDPFDASLYQTDICRWRPARLTSLGRYSFVSAAAGRVVVANAGEGVDRVGLIERNRIAPIAGGQSPNGSTPVLASNGDIAYVTAGTDGSREFGVHRVAPSGQDGLVYRSPNPLAPLAFLSSAIVAAEAPNKPGSIDASGRTFLTVIDAGRRTKTIALPLTAVRGLAASGTTGSIAVSGTESEEGVIIKASTGRIARRLERGWQVAAYSPDGRFLLLHRDRSIGILDLTVTHGEPQIVREVTQGPVYSAAWTT